MTECVSRAVLQHVWAGARRRGWLRPQAPALPGVRVHRHRQLHTAHTHMGSAAKLALPMLCCDSSALPAPVRLGVCMGRRAAHDVMQPPRDEGVCMCVDAQDAPAASSLSAPRHTAAPLACTCPPWRRPASVYVRASSSRAAVPAGVGLRVMLVRGAQHRVRFAQTPPLLLRVLPNCAVRRVNRIRASCSFLTWSLTRCRWTCDHSDSPRSNSAGVLCM